jgi:hypothetical protein
LEYPDVNVIDTRLETMNDMFTEMLLNDLKVSVQEGIPMPTGDKAIIAAFLKQNYLPANRTVAQLKEYSPELKKELELKRAENAARILAKPRDEELDDLI